LPIWRMERQTLENDDVMYTENATGYVEFHTVSEFTEGISETEENSTDHTIQNKGQENEAEVQSNEDTLSTCILLFSTGVKGCVRSCSRVVNHRDCVEHKLKTSGTLLPDRPRSSEGFSPETNEG
jgi:hypothetical protein